MRTNNVSIPDEIYRHPRLCAARSYLSVSALVRKFLESLLELPSPRAAKRVRTLNRPTTPHPPL